MWSLFKFSVVGVEVDIKFEGKKNMKEACALNTSGNGGSMACGGFVKTKHQSFTLNASPFANPRTIN